MNSAKTFELVDLCTHFWFSNVGVISTFHICILSSGNSFDLFFQLTTKCYKEINIICYSDMFFVYFPYVGCNTNLINTFTELVNILRLPLRWLQYKFNQYFYGIDKYSETVQLYCLRINKTAAQYVQQFEI